MSIKEKEMKALDLCNTVIREAYIQALWVRKESLVKNIEKMQKELTDIEYVLLMSSGGDDD